MIVRELLRDIEILSVKGDEDITIREIRHHSGQVEPGDLFVALKGVHADGHTFIENAVSRGAAAVVHEREEHVEHALSIRVDDTSVALADLADAFYGSPAKNLTIVGITGTNGKTTTSYMIKNILETAGYPCGLFGTIQYMIGNDMIVPLWTTPEALELHRLLARMRDRRMRCVVMEVSSHALKQRRVHGIQFSVGVFTNLTRDHLDYHPDMEDYRRSKEMLFEQLDPVMGWGVANLDDPVGEELPAKFARHFITYSRRRGMGDVYPESIETSFAGIRGSFETPAGSLRISSKLTGEFNVSNILAAIGTGIAMEIEPEAIIEGIEETEVIPGRFERVDEGQPFSVIVDYAHTPDSVERALETARKITRGRLIGLLGCGGDRDHGKREIMGRIVSSLADLAIITSDNPRTENPDAIIDDIFKGIPAGVPVVRIADRKAAIEYALSLAGPDDAVMLLGKGHENYQVIGRTKFPFDDREIARKWIRGRSADGSPEYRSGGIQKERNSQRDTL